MRGHQLVYRIIVKYVWRIGSEKYSWPCGLMRISAHISANTLQIRIVYLDQYIDGITTYGSVSAGREKWPFNVIFFLKVEPPCDQT